jgi:glycosyltransferase involved in cell wall biosynthesis
MKLSVCYSMYLNHTGYSLAAQEYVLSLAKTHGEVDVRCRLFHNAPIGISRTRQSFFQCKKTDEVREGDISIFQSVPDIYKRFPQAAKNIGFCVYETISLPKRWITKLNDMDIVLTASEFNKGIFESNGIIKPIRVVPHCFDPCMFNKSIQPLGRFAQTTFFAIGQWRERKNWESLIRGFYEAFCKKDNACLLIKTDKPESLAGTIERIKRTEKWRSKDTCPVYGEAKNICSFEEIPYTMKKGDFYVSTSLGEGFGLPGLHAMALGIPVLTTRFGGALQYAKQDNCTFFEPAKYETRPTLDGFPQFKNSVWPVISVQEIASKLRQVFDKFPTEKTERAYRYAHENFNYNVVGNQLYEALIK